MIDNLIVYIKNLPHLFSFCTQRLKQTWKWFAISLIIGLVIILALEGFLISTILLILFKCVGYSEFHHSSYSALLYNLFI